MASVLIVRGPDQGKSVILREKLQNRRVKSKEYGDFIHDSQVTFN